MTKNDIRFFFPLYFSDSQTIETKDKTQQTSKDAFTQVQVRNILIQTTNDKFTQPSETYIPADEIQTEYLAKV